MIQFTRLSIAPEIEKELSRVLKSWEKTPYRANQQRMNCGVDCVRFVCGVYDELYKVNTSIALLPKDIAFHNPEGARSGMRALVRAYQGRVLDRDDFSLEPGDTVVAAPRGGGPGHAMIAGPWPTLWHAVPGGVCWTGHNFEGLSFSGIVRAPNKESWVR